MLATQSKSESCAINRCSAKQKRTDHLDDNDERYEHALQQRSKDFFCDASLMDDINESNTLQNENSTRNSINYPNRIDNEDIEMMDISQSNEMKIDQKDEEKTILELVETSSINNGQLVEVQNNSQMRVAFGIILRLVLPLARGVARSIKSIRDVRFLRVLNAIASSRRALTNLLAFAANSISMNLSSVQVSHRIEPILKLLKIRKHQHGLESLPDVQHNDVSMPSIAFSPYICESNNFGLPNFRKKNIPDQHATKCCSLKVLAEPPPGEKIRADIIFIHGLHGSLVNTWKQGLWENDRRPVEFPRPPKPPLRPPKRARHSRSTCIRPPHKHKRARIGLLEDICRHSIDNEINEEFEDNKGNDSFTYICGEARDIKICDGIEYSFPTFRIRMNDEKGHLLTAEMKSNANGRESSDKKDTTKTRSKPKMTANDPNYSKCWPRDWLPLDCPGVRVIAVNYTTDPYLWRPLWMKKEPRSNLIQRAREMAELLIEQKVGYGHPIIWVGHSKGGLFVKQIIVDAWESGRPAMAPLWRSAKGCFFYSVPHRGSHLASIKAPLLTRSVELIDIEKNSNYLLDLHRRFAGLYYLGHLKVEVFSFVETALTLMSVLYLRIVGVDSADPGIGDVCGIRLDHREICKPRSRDCILYKELVKMIKKVS